MRRWKIKFRAVDDKVIEEDSFFTKQGAINYARDMVRARSAFGFFAPLMYDVELWYKDKLVRVMFEHTDPKTYERSLRGS